MKIGKDRLVAPTTRIVSRGALRLLRDETPRPERRSRMIQLFEHQSIDTAPAGIVTARPRMTATKG